SILTIGPADVAKLAGLYGAVGLLHGLCRRPMLAAAGEGPQAPGVRTTLWDFVFYASFGLVVTSSVALAGVLLVFSFLIIPAVIGTLFARRIGIALLIGWAAGVLASLLGFGASLVLDLPTGATMVAAFAVVLVAAALARILFVGPLPARRLRRRYAALAAGCILALALLAQSAWLILSPAGDHPLLAGFETLSGLGPERFLTPPERRVYADAAATELRHRTEVERLRATEREARWKGQGLAEEELRRVASFQQTFNEMGRGERFVQDHLRAVARARERWYVGLPAALIAALLLLRLGRVLIR
ncbi:MAG: metal ABC transporter permease, partial [Solirubrobacterales bacterium]